MNLSTSIINDDLQLVRILERMDLDEYEPTDMPMTQPDELPHKLTGIGMAPTSDTLSTSELAAVTGVHVFCIQELSLTGGPVCLTAHTPP